MRSLHLALAACAALLAACGGLESPNLAEGNVAGRLVGARSGAYVYVLGRTDLKVPVAGDRYAISGVPAGPQALVVIDRPAEPEYATSCRAVLVHLAVAGAEENDALELEAESLPSAASVIVAAQPGGGATPGSGTFTVVGTEVEVVTTTGVAVLYPLPCEELDADGAGTTTTSWTVSVAMAGFQPAEIVVPVEASVVEPVYADTTAAAPGCASTGCRSPLKCDTSSGGCYACLLDADCVTTGQQCIDHECRDPAALGGACDACDPNLATSQCGTKDPICAAGGYCTRACTSDGDCIYGLTCDLSGGSPGLCRPASTCQAYRDGFWGQCWTSGDCGGLGPNAVCLGASGTMPGRCTTHCIRSTTDCSVAPAFACSCTSGCMNTANYYCKPQ